MTELEQLVTWLNRIGVEYVIKKYDDGDQWVIAEPYEDNFFIGLGVWFDEHECAKVDSGQFSW